MIETTLDDPRILRLEEVLPWAMLCNRADARSQWEGAEALMRTPITVWEGKP